MVAEIMNTMITLLTGQATDAWGNLVDAGTPATTHIPAFLAETRETTWDPATQMPRTVRNITLRVQQWFPVYAGFESPQILDETTGEVFFVEDVVIPPTIIGAPVDPRIHLRRVTGPTA